jgi:hypothetical protein
MNFENVNVSMDSFNHIWVDIQVDDIKVLQRAALIGGSMSVYEHNENYYMSFCHQSESSFINFYGLQISKDHFDFYLQSWGDCHCEIIQGNELQLTEDTYFKFPKFESEPRVENALKKRSVNGKKGKPSLALS